MNRKLFFFLPVLLFLVGFQVPPDKKCDFNLEINEDWEEKLTDKQFPFNLVEKKSYIPVLDSSEMDKEDIYQEEKMINIFIFASTNEDSKEIRLTLTENVFHTSCAAYKNFKNTLIYYQSKQPLYEYNTNPCVGIIQGNKFFKISTQSGEEKVMEKFMEAFFKVLLKNSFQKDTVFIRDTEAPAVLK